MKPFSPRQLRIIAIALDTQLRAGHTLPTVLARLGKIMPAYSDFWRNASNKVGDGALLSDQLSGMATLGLVESIRAGEKSGNLADVAARIVQAMDVMELIKEAIAKLYYPLVVMAAGIGIFFFYMIVVVPSMSAGFGGTEGDALVELAIWMRRKWDAHREMIVVAVAVGVVAIGHFLSRKETWGELMMILDDIPLLNEGLRNLYYGLWAYYMMILDTARLPVIDALNYSAGVVPPVYQESLRRVASDIPTKGMSGAADLNALPPDDPRQRWPHFVPNVFHMAHQSGRLSETLEMVAPSMIKVGVEQIKSAVEWFRYGVYFALAVLLALPFLAYFAQIATSMQHIMKN